MNLLNSVIRLVGKREVFEEFLPFDKKTDRIIGRVNEQESILLRKIFLSKGDETSTLRRVLWSSIESRLRLVEGEEVTIRQDGRIVRSKKIGFLGDYLRLAEITH